MAKENKSEAPKSKSPGAKKTDVRMTRGTPGNTPKAQPASTTGAQSTASQVRQGASEKGNRPRIGGTAVPGAKSTQPKEVAATNPQQQQAESYNRVMRRRMEHLGTGPGQGSTLQDQRRKRLEKRKRRIEERKQEVRKVAASGPRKISLGRRNTYFLIAVVVVIIVVIAIAIIVNYIK